MASDLISKTAVLNDISDLMKSPWYNDGNGGEHHLQYLARKDAVEVVKVLCVEKESTVDAVPVVRCRDCKFYYGVNEECGCNGGYHLEDWFCADGERRNNK